MHACQVLTSKAVCGMRFVAFTTYEPGIFPDVVLLDVRLQILALVPLVLCWFALLLRWRHHPKEGLRHYHNLNEIWQHYGNAE